MWCVLITRISPRTLSHLYWRYLKIFSVTRLRLLQHSDKNDSWWLELGVEEVLTGINLIELRCLDQLPENAQQLRLVGSPSILM